MSIVWFPLGTQSYTKALIRCKTTRKVHTRSPAQLNIYKPVLLAPSEDLVCRNGFHYDSWSPGLCAMPAQFAKDTNPDAHRTEAFRSDMLRVRLWNYPTRL